MNDPDPIWNHVTAAHEDRKIVKHPQQWTTSRNSENFLISFLIHDCKIPASAILVTTSEKERSTGWASMTVKGVTFLSNVGLHQIEASYNGKRFVINEPADVGEFVTRHGL